MKPKTWLQRLEQQIGPSPCETCATHAGVRLADPHEPLEPCPECGALPLRVTLNLGHRLQPHERTEPDGLEVRVEPGLELDNEDTTDPDRLDEPIPGQDH
jgi:hypothetical protein